MNFSFGKFGFSLDWKDILGLTILFLLIYMIWTGTSPMQLWRDLLNVISK